MKYFDIEQFCVHESTSVLQCMQVIDGNKRGIALVVDAQGRLIGTVTDGDIRRFLLRGHSLEERVSHVMWAKPLTAPKGTRESEIKALMRTYLVRNIPVLDENGRPCDLMSLGDLVREDAQGRIAVIMAGGEGRRLRPLTEHVPKPMLKVGGRPIIENIVRAFGRCGITDIYVTVNFKAEVIKNHFDSSDLGANITYLHEEKMLGTAGSLQLLPELPPKPIIVINGDIITKINFDRLIEYHEEHRCVMTVGTIQYTLDVPYGVLDVAGHYLVGITEKPARTFLCNAGIYMINPELVPLIPPDVEYHMTDLIEAVVRKGLPVTTFPIHEYWIDIGQMEELQRAKIDSQEE